MTGAGRAIGIKFQSRQNDFCGDFIWTSRPGRSIMKGRDCLLCGANKFHYPVLMACGNIRNRQPSYNGRQAGREHVLESELPVAIRALCRDKDPGASFQFNLNGELKFITGRGKDWPSPSEWLKRTVAGDWVYYSAGGYDGPYDCFGEYYIPCLS